MIGMMSETIKALFELREIVQVHPLRFLAYDSAAVPNTNDVVVFVAPEKYDALGIPGGEFPLWGYVYKDGVFKKVYEGVEPQPVFSIAIGDYDGDRKLEIAMLQGPGSNIIMRRIELNSDGIRLHPVLVDTQMDMQASTEIQSFDIDKDEISELMVVFADGTVKYYYSIGQKSTSEEITFGAVTIFNFDETEHVVKAVVDVSSHHNYVVFLVSCGDYKVRVRTIYNNKVTNEIREIEFQNPVSAITAKMLDSGGYIAVAVDISGQAKILYYTSGKMHTWTENLLRVVDCGVFTANLVSIHEAEGEEKLLLALGAGDGDVQFFIVEPNYEHPDSDQIGMFTYLCDVKFSGRMIFDSRALNMPRIQESMIFYHLEGVGRELIQPLLIHGSPKAIHRAAMELFDGGTSWMKGLDTVDIIVRLGKAKSLWEQIPKLHTEPQLKRQAENILAQMEGIAERVEKELVDDFSEATKVELEELRESVDQNQFAEVEKSISRVGGRLKEISRHASKSTLQQLVSMFNDFCKDVFSTVRTFLSAAMDESDRVLEQKIDESEFAAILNTVASGLSVFPRVRDILDAKMEEAEEEHHKSLLLSLVGLYGRYRRKATLKRDTAPEECEAYRQMAIEFDESMKEVTERLSDYYEIGEYHENVKANLAKDERVKCDEPRQGPVTIHPAYNEIDGRGEFVLTARNNEDLDIGELQVELVLDGDVASFEPGLLRTSTLVKMGEIGPHGKKESDPIPIYGYTAGQVKLRLSGSYSRYSEGGTWIDANIPKREFAYGRISRILGTRKLEDFVRYAKDAYQGDPYKGRGQREGTGNVDRVREETEIALARILAPFDAISVAPTVFGGLQREQMKFYILYPDSVEKAAYLQARINATQRQPGAPVLVQPEVEFYGPDSVQREWKRIQEDLTDYLKTLSEKYTKCRGCRSRIRNWDIDDKNLGSYEVAEIAEYLSDAVRHPELVRYVKLRDEKIARLQCPFCNTYNEVAIDEIV